MDDPSTTFHSAQGESSTTFHSAQGESSTTFHSAQGESSTTFHSAQGESSTTFHSAQDESSLTLRSAQEGGGKFLIGIVGVCGSGKSTLIAGLKAHGYHCRHIAQEHSYVPAMWQIVTNPDLLIYLSVSFENSTSRRKLNWTPADYEEQLRRLAHARQNAHLVIDTDSLAPDEVLAKAVNYLKGKRA